MRRNRTRTSLSRSLTVTNHQLYVSLQVGSDVVVASYGDSYAVVYNFTDDSVTRQPPAVQGPAVQTTASARPPATRNAAATRASASAGTGTASLRGGDDHDHNDHDDYDSIITAVHARAAVSRAKRVASWATHDFGYDHATAGEPNSSTWTGVGFSNIAQVVKGQKKKSGRDECPRQDFISFTTRASVLHVGPGHMRGIERKRLARHSRVFERPVLC